MISLEILKILTPLQKSPKNVRDLGKLIVAKGLKTCPKSNKSPNMVTLPTTSVNLKVDTVYRVSKQAWVCVRKGAPQVSLTAPNRDHFAPVSLTLI